MSARNALLKRVIDYSVLCGRAPSGDGARHARFTPVAGQPHPAVRDVALDPGAAAVLATRWPTAHRAAIANLPHRWRGRF
jgi:hypothetical protein